MTTQKQNEEQETTPDRRREEIDPDLQRAFDAAASGEKRVAIVGVYEIEGDHFISIPIPPRLGGAKLTLEFVTPNERALRVAVKLTPTNEGTELQVRTWDALEEEGPSFVAEGVDGDLDLDSLGVGLYAVTANPHTPKPLYDVLIETLEALGGEAEKGGTPITRGISVSSAVRNPGILRSWFPDAVKILQGQVGRTSRRKGRG